MTAEVAEAPVITEAGVYDIPEDMYHADPVPGGSLSSHGARKLLEPSCPAKFAWEREHPFTPSAAMELGTAAHKLVLGVGQEIREIEADDWRGKAAKTAADEARAEGAVPLLTRDMATVTAMAQAIRRHPIAAKLFDPWSGGTPEQSFFAPDDRTGVWRRARLDWMPDPSAARPVIADYKTARTANPEAFGRSAGDLGYHIQQVFYQQLWADVLGTEADFVFVVQEKEPPYLVSVCQLDYEAVKAARVLVDRALEIYRDCAEAGVWPGYTDDVALVSLPYWAVRRAEEPLS